MLGDKILIIDDDRSFTKLLGIGLQKKGYQIVIANDGEEGLGKAAAEKPRLILLDIKMPEMDGLTFLREIKKEDALRNIPVIMLTGFGPMKELFEAEGIAGFFVKTDEREKLFEMIKTALQAAGGN